MKKVLVFGLAATIALSLTACGGAVNNTDRSGQTAQPIEEPAGTEENEHQKDDGSLDT